LALADVVATSSDPRLGAIRLAWWRERLEELDTGGPVPAEPRLQAVAEELLMRGVCGKELSQLEDAWLPVLEPFPWGRSQAAGLKLRGRILFGVGARLLGHPSAEAESSGELWSLVDGAAHCSDRQSNDLLFKEARGVRLSARSPAKLRTMTVLGALAASDMEGRRGVARVATALLHRLTGSSPGS
jgi:15-cis-phytoene synthase